MDIESYLQSLGLNEKEIGVYLANLSLGEVSIVPIVAKTRLPRTTVYHILERLNSEKLIEIITTGTRRMYVPYSPRTILTRLRERKEFIEQQIDGLQHSLPELMQLYNVSPIQPKVRMYHGQEVRQIFEDITNSPIDKIEYVGETTKIVSVTGEVWLKKWIQKRADLGIKSYSIRIADEEITDPMYGHSAKLARTVRYAPAGFHAPTQVYIYGDSVALITTTAEGFGLIITSRDYATTMRNWFKELWKISRDH
jgi:sugar-specific transcriptional regulator TrmB